MLAYAEEIKQSVTYVQEFTGYNHNLRCAEGQFYDMRNMTGDYYPVLSTRSLRTQLLVLNGAPQAMFAKDYVYYIVNGNIVWGDNSGTNGSWVEKGRINNALSSTGKKQVADIGANVLILPDKKIFNAKTHTLSNATFYYESNTWTRVVSGVSYTTTGKFRLTPSTLEGDPIIYTASATAPSDTSKYWLNTGDKKIYIYNSTTEAWQQLDNVYLKVEPHLTYNSDVGAGSSALEWLDAIKATINSLHDYDTVNLTLNTYDSSYGQLGGDTVIFHVGNGFFTIVGIQPQQFETDFAFTLRFPEMAFITSLNNRVWGCSPDGRQIYASRLGDASQWFNFAGLSSDSFAATVGSDGEFTGAIAYNNNVLFFKKDRLHRIFGNYPSNFQVTEYAVNGVASGCDKTLAVVNGYLFYLGEESVMIYDGSLPRNCSEAFGDLRFKSGVAGQQMNKYYLSADDGTEIRQFVYDTENRQWWKEDDTKMVDACTYFNALYSIHYVKADNGNWVYVLTKEVGSYEGTMDWFVETGDLGLNTPYQKYISKIQVRMAFEGTMFVEISYNGGQFTRVLEKTFDSLRSYTVPINVKRCDHFRIRIGGEGICKIYSMGYNTEVGSEIC